MPTLNHNLQRLDEKCTDCGNDLYLRCNQNTITLEKFDYIKHCNYCGNVIKLNQQELDKLGLISIE